jgi:hypothetical protein
VGEHEIPGVGTFTGPDWVMYDDAGGEIVSGDYAPPGSGEKATISWDARGTSKLQPPGPRPYVVVLFTGSECEDHPGKPCVMEARGPYTKGEAEAVMAELLETAPWTAPHRLIVDGLVK